MCEKCQDRGFILINQNGLDVAKDCECKPLLEFERRCKVSGISRAFQEKTFANFDVGENQARIVARDVALQYCGAFPEIKDAEAIADIVAGRVCKLLSEMKLEQTEVLAEQEADEPALIDESVLSFLSAF